MSIFFGQKLRELRKKKGLYQKEIAEEFGVARVTVTSWEKGQKEPSYDMLIALANFFNVSVDYLIGNINQDK